MDIRIIILLIVIASILVTCVLDQIFKKKRYIKYIPVIIMVPFIIYYFVTMYSTTTEGFESLGRFVMGLLLLAVGLSSFLYSVTADIIHRRRKLHK
jgi:hypothetical protein